MHWVLILVVTWAPLAALLALLLGRSIKLGDLLDSPRTYEPRPDLAEVPRSDLRMAGAQAR
jgi:hypothetical protein